MSVSYPQLTHQIGGNTAGATANISAGTFLLAGGPNITVSQNGNSVSISAGAGGAGDGVNIVAAGTQTANTTGSVLFQNSNGITFGMSNSSVVTASHNGLTSQSNQALSAGNGSFTFQTASFADSNGISFSTGTQGLYASHNGLTSQSNQALSGSNGSFTFQTATFGNLNGFSFYTSNGSMVGSYTVPTVTNSAWTVSDSATSGTVARLAFTNQNGVTLSLSTGAGGSHTIVGSHNGLTSQSNQAVSGSNGSFTFQTATFGNLNGLSFYTSNGSMVGSYTVPTVTAGSDTVGISNLGNTSGTSGVVSGDSIRYLFAGGNNITLSQSINGASATVTISAGNAAPSPVNFSAGTTSNDIGSIVFSNSNGVSFGLDGSTITASISPGGGGLTASMYPADPTALATSSAYPGGTTTTAGGSRTSFSYYISPLVVEEYVTFDKVFCHLSQNSSAGTYSQSMGAMWALYTNDAGTLRTVSTWALGAQLSQNSITNYTQKVWWGTNSTSNSSQTSGNVSASFARLNQALVHTGASSLTPGQYWLGYAYTVSSNGGSFGISQMHWSKSQSTGGSMWGTNVSSRFMPYIGIYSFTSSSANAHVYIFPDAINNSAITGTGGSSQNRYNILFFASGV